MCLGDRCILTGHPPSAVAVQEEEEEEEGQHSDQGSVETLYNISDWVERRQALLKLQ